MRGPTWSKRSIVSTTLSNSHPRTLVLGRINLMGCLINMLLGMDHSVSISTCNKAIKIHMVVQHHRYIMLGYTYTHLHECIHRYMHRCTLIYNDWIGDPTFFVLVHARAWTITYSVNFIAIEGISHLHNNATCMYHNNWYIIHIYS